jgi:hypothetical protein
MLEKGKGNKVASQNLRKLSLYLMSNYIQQSNIMWSTILIYVCCFNLIYLIMKITKLKLSRRTPLFFSFAKFSFPFL